MCAVFSKKKTVHYGDITFNYRSRPLHYVVMKAAHYRNERHFTEASIKWPIVDSGKIFHRQFELLNTFLSRKLSNQ